MVAEGQDVAHAQVAPQVEAAVAPGQQHPLHLLGSHGVQVAVVLGRLDDHLMGAQPVHQVIGPLAPPVRGGLHLEHRVLARDHPELPGPIRPAVGEDGWRGLGLVAGAKRAGPRRSRGLFF